MCRWAAGVPDIRISLYSVAQYPLALCTLDLLRANGITPIWSISDAGAAVPAIIPSVTYFTPVSVVANPWLDGTV